MDYFLNFTCNQKKNFGMKPIKDWLDGHDWTKHFNGYEDCTIYEKRELTKAIL